MFQVYGGDESWSFIEENSYRLLIDSILEEQEKSERENYEPKLLENSDPPLLIENGVSKVNVLPLSVFSQYLHLFVFELADYKIERFII